MQRGAVSFPFPPEPPSSFVDKATPFGADSLASAGAALDEDCKDEINEGLVSTELR